MRKQAQRSKVTSHWGPVGKGWSWDSNQPPEGLQNTQSVDSMERAPVLVASRWRFTYQLCKR